MKAPEKIYLQENTTTDCYDELWPEWFEARAKDNDVEYTRTDAFIEKACKWLDENWTSFVNYDDEDSVVYYGNLTDKFKDYMKGE